MISKEKMVNVEWLLWATHDEHGMANGIRKDAPEEIIRAYQDFIKEEEELRREGWKL